MQKSFFIIFLNLIWFLIRDIFLLIHLLIKSRISYHQNFILYFHHYYHQYFL